MKNDLAFGRIPVKASGSATTYEADGLWFNNALTCYARAGAARNSALADGPMAVMLLYDAASKGGDVGAALSCKPLAV